MRLDASLARPTALAVPVEAGSDQVPIDAVAPRAASLGPSASSALRSTETLALLARVASARAHSSVEPRTVHEASRAGARDGSDIDEQALRSLAADLVGASSSDLLLLALEQELGSRVRGGVEDRLRDAELDARQASVERTKARARAARAARRARRAARHAPPWVRKLVKAILAVAGVAAAACTGGAAAGVAIAGLALTLGAPAFEKLAEKLGLDPAKARWVGFACSLAGASLSVGGGIASAGSVVGAARGMSEAARNVADAARVTRSVIEGLTGLVDGVRQAASAAHEHRVADATFDAERASLRAIAAEDALDALADVLRALLGHTERLARFANDVVEIQNGSREALIGALAGTRR